LQKSLVALAALAATTAFAQSSVTMSGVIDFANSSTTGTMYAAKGKTVSTTIGTSATSAINIIAVEDLGGGMKVEGRYEIDPRTFANDSTAVTNNIVATGTDSNANTVTGLARHQAFVALSGSFGTVKLGAPNSTGLDGSGASSPLGTGVGSGYAPASNTMFNAVVSTRFSGRAVRYESPVMNGFSATYHYAAGNDEAAVTASSLNVAQNVINTKDYNEIGLKYSNGPLNAVFAQVKQGAQTNSTGWYAASSAGATAAVNHLATTGRIWGANYKLGDTTVYLGGTSGDAHTSTTAIKVAKGSRMAIKHTVGNVDLIAQSTKQKLDTVEAKVTGARVDYNLSKTAAAYIGYEKWDTGAAASSSSTGDRKITSIGLRKSF
jgi:Gram-negative porin